MSLFQVDQDNSTLGAIQQNLDRFRTLKLKSKMEIMKFLNDASFLVKFIYSEKATKFCEIFTLLLFYVVPVKSKVEISQNFVAFSEYMNFTSMSYEVRHRNYSQSVNKVFGIFFFGDWEI